MLTLHRSLVATAAYSTAYTMYIRISSEERKQTLIYNLVLMCSTQWR